MAPHFPPPPKLEETLSTKPLISFEAIEPPPVVVVATALSPVPAAFDALEDVFGRLGHKEASSERLPYTAWRRFRQIPQALDDPLRAFFAGESEAFLEQVILSLVEKPDARSDAAAVQSRLEELRLFYEVEGAKLRVILEMEGGSYIAQTERDRAAIRAGFKEEDEDEGA